MSDKAGTAAGISNLLNFLMDHFALENNLIM